MPRDKESRPHAVAPAAPAAPDTGATAGAWQTGALCTLYTRTSLRKAES